MPEKSLKAGTKTKISNVGLPAVVLTKAGKLAAAAIIYIVFAIYLYQPYLKNFGPAHCSYVLLIFSAAAGSFGCLLLSRRWVGSLAGSFLAGAIFGFGPFMLGLSRFHPSVSILAAAVPWLLLPASLIQKRKWRFLLIALSLLPFLAIIIFFQLASFYHFYPVPLQVKLTPADLLGIAWPLAAAEKNLNTIGFYHIAPAAMIIGILLMIQARRGGTFLILAAGVAASFFPPFLNISPIIWFAIPAACLAVLAGVGIEALALAGAADKKWILLIILFFLVLSGLSFLAAQGHIQLPAALLPINIALFNYTVRIYLLGAAVSILIFAIVRSRMRFVIIRRIMLFAAIIVDIFFGAQFIISKIL